MWNIRRHINVVSIGLRNGARIFEGNGFPTSGTTGTGIGLFDSAASGPDTGSIYIDSETGTEFINRGSKTSPYWYPRTFDQPSIAGVGTDFRRFATKAGSDTATIYQDKGTGVRVFGLGIGENDANTAQTLSHPVNGPLLTMGTENQANFMTALGYGSTTALWTPATNGPLVIEANFTAITDILTRSIFLGFCGEAVDAMVPPVAGDTVTMTFEATGTQGDNTHGLFMDSRLTDAAGVFFPSVKANAAATRTTTVAELDTPTDLAAAATYNRWRVEIDAAGNTRAFINRVQVKLGLLGASTTVALMPVFGHANTTTTAALSLGVREFYAYGKRA